MLSEYLNGYLMTNTVLLLPRVEGGVGTLPACKNCAMFVNDQHFNGYSVL